MITRLHARGKAVVSPLADRKCCYDVPPSTDHCDYHQINENTAAALHVISHLSAHSTHTVQSSFQAAPEVEEDAHRISQFILWICVPIHFGLALVSIGLHRCLYLNEDTVSKSQSDFSPGTLVAYLLAGFTQVCCSH